jgi:large subunit ribosomal protein L28
MLASGCTVSGTGGAGGIMAKVCALTGRRTSYTTTSTRKGSPRKKGGVGLKKVGVHKRTVKPNLQKKTVWVDGAPKRIWISAKALRNLDPTLLVNPQKLRSS